MGGRTNLTKTPFLVLFVILISVGIGTTSLANAQLGAVPDWFKGVAGFWVEGKITTTEFLEGVEFLIDKEVILVPGYVQAAEAETGDQESFNDIWITIDSLQNQVNDLQLKINHQDSVRSVPPCWDLNGNGLEDIIVRAGGTSEDMNGDGIVNVNDCVVTGGYSEVNDLLVTNDLEVNGHLIVDKEFTCVGCVDSNDLGSGTVGKSISELGVVRFFANDGGSFSEQMSLSDRSFCAITEIQMFGEGGWCEIRDKNEHWEIYMGAREGGDVRCTARCFG